MLSSLGVFNRPGSPPLPQDPVRPSNPPSWARSVPLPGRRICILWPNTGGPAYRSGVASEGRSRPNL